MNFGPGIIAYFSRYMEAAHRIMLAGVPGYTESQCSACPYTHDCCNLIVTASAFEASAIIAYLLQYERKRAEFWRKRIKQRARFVRRFFARFKTGDEAIDAWHAKGVKCVFYNEGKSRCEIYSVRPMTCRTLFSTDDCSRSLWRTSQEDAVSFRRRAGFLHKRDHHGRALNYGELACMVDELIGDQKVEVETGFLAQLARSGEGSLTDNEIFYGSEAAAPSPGEMRRHEVEHGGIIAGDSGL